MRMEKESSPKHLGPSVGPEAVAFMLDLGICPGSECPAFWGGCDARCPLLQGLVCEPLEE